MSSIGKPGFLNDVNIQILLFGGKGGMGKDYGLSRQRQRLKINIPKIPAPGLRHSL